MSYVQLNIQILISAESTQTTRKMTNKTTEQTKELQELATHWMSLTKDTN